MKRVFSILLAVVALFGVVSCIYVSPPKVEKSDVETITKCRLISSEQMANFDAIKAKQRISVIYSQGGKPEVRVYTDVKDSTLLNIRVEDNELILEYKPSVKRIDESVHTIVEVSGYNVNDFDVTSGAEIELKEAYVTTGEVELEGSSSGRITFLNLKADKVNAKVSSGAEVRFEGVVRELEAEASSGAAINVPNITAEEISADASSGAGIHLKGTATRVSYEASSGASLKAGDLAAEKGEVKASSGASVKANVKYLTQKTSSGASLQNVIR